MYDTGDYLVFAFLGLMGLFLVSLIGYGTTDTIQNLRARPAKYACLARNLEPERLDLSSRVVCRSRQTGADSVTVNLVHPQ